MNTIINAFFVCLSAVVLVDLLQRHVHGAAYRELLNKKKKTDIEQAYLREYGKFFKLNLWHKLYLIIFLGYLTLMFTP